MSATANEPDTLTDKFTDAERVALTEFQSQIPAIALKYPNKLWGVDINSTDPRANVILMKFLRARNLNAAEAASMLTEALSWREEFDVDQTVNFPEAFGKLGYVHGKDKAGRPVTYNLYDANQDLSTKDKMERFVRWRVKLMEEGIAKLNFVHTDQIVQVLDYEGVSWYKQAEDSKSAASEVNYIFQNYYPAFLTCEFKINVPIIFYLLSWLFPQKFVVVRRNQHAISKALENMIDVEEIPTKYKKNGS